MDSDYEINRKIKPVKGLMAVKITEKCGIIPRAIPLCSSNLCCKLYSLSVPNHSVIGNAYLGDSYFGLHTQSIFVKFINCLFKGKI